MKNENYLSRKDTLDGLFGGVGLAAFLLGAVSIFFMGVDWYSPYITKILFWVACAIWFFRPSVSPIMAILEIVDKHGMPPQSGRTFLRIIQSIIILAIAGIVYFENYSIH